jgi:transcriptional regulator with XRE-family HTH domain
MTTVSLPSGTQAVLKGSNHPHAPVTLRALRLLHGSSLRDAQEATGIHRGRISELERGLRWPRTRELEALENYYNTRLRVAFVILADEEA